MHSHPPARQFRRSRRFLTLGIIAIGAAFLFVACNGNSDPDEPPMFTTEGPPTEATAPIATGTPTPAATTATASPTPTATTEATATPAAPRTPGWIGSVSAWDSVVLERPVDMTEYTLGGYEIAIAEQNGYIYGVSADGAEVILDISGRVVAPGNEEGLLSFTLDPAFESNRHVWVYFSADNPRRSILSRFTANEDGTIDRDSELPVLPIEQPYANHNGGTVRFGPDGMLYLGIGDGGSGGDPQGHGQNTMTLLGTVIRIDVSSATEDVPYVIPADNPFIDDDAVLNEIWAYGLRNPWRMAFDPATGNLWAADVGQNLWEEVNILHAGGNFGWAIVEGPECFRASTCDRTGLTPPVAYYANADGRCSVNGGIIARNVTATNVEGAYLFGDFCSGEIWGIPANGIEAGEAGALAGSNGAVLIGSGFGNIISMAQVGDEVYVISFGRPLQRLVNQ